jgi:hypothetical protein
MSTTPRLWKSLTQVSPDAPVGAGGNSYGQDGQVVGLLDGG